MTYAEKLKDPRWQKKRLQVLERDHWMCQDCFSTDKTLHVRHLAYEKGFEPWEYPDEYLITLCHECHERTEKEKSWRELYLLRLARLAVRSRFYWDCFHNAIAQSSDFENLLFYIFSLTPDKSAKILAQAYELKNVDLYEQLKYLQNPCPTCGSPMSYLHDRDLVICSACRFTPADLINDSVEKTDTNGE